MTLTLTLDGVTYGELYEFVDAARAAGVPPEEAVRCLGSDDLGDRFEVDLGPGRRRPGAGGAAAQTFADDAPEGAPGPHRDDQRPPVVRMTEAVRSMVRDDDDLDRLVATLKDMRRFLR